jgi:hypothetical protein
MRGKAKTKGLRITVRFPNWMDSPYEAEAMRKDLESLLSHIPRKWRLSLDIEGADPMGRKYHTMHRRRELEDRRFVDKNLRPGVGGERTTADAARPAD